jgi:hypothetical protein
MFKSIILNSVVMLSLAVAAQAETAKVPRTPFAELVDVEGKVLVSHGQGFVAAGSNTALSLGDQVMVSGDSRAALVYSGADCTVTLNAQTLVQITAEPPCKAGADLAMAGQTIVTPAALEGTFAGGNNSRLVALGGLVVVAGVVTLVAIGYDKPAPVSKP